MEDFAEKMEAIASRSKAAERQALTEEATKTSVIMPLIQALGFDVFSLDEVVPEFTTDVGTKKGEKVDYALKIDGKIAMLVEAKPISAKLGDAQYTQLFRYFTVTDARLAILTNGHEVWFFSDTEEPNKMDKKPFFKFDLQSHDKSQVAELARFQKDSFHIDAIIEAASNLKYTRDAAAFLKQQLSDPDDDFVRFVGRQIHEGSVTKTVQEQIKPALQAALDQIIRDRIQDKLSITFQERKPAKVLDDSPDEQSLEDSDIVTTPEEWEGFYIVRAIAARHVPVDRVTIRDAKSYCSIIMDDNNRKPICRLYFNSATTKNVGIFDNDKKETKFKVEKAQDLYQHAEAIEAVIQNYV
jgi:hypothetical protein